MTKQEIRQIIKEEILKEIKILRPGNWKEGASSEAINKISNYKGIGDLDLRGDDIKTLPINFKVGGDLRLSGSSIFYLPQNLKVGGFIDLDNTQNLSYISPGLEVGGDLDIDDSTITSLPSNLKVGGTLTLLAYRGVSVPPTIQVGGDFWLSIPDSPPSEHFLNVRGEIKYI